MNKNLFFLYILCCSGWCSGQVSYKMELIERTKSCTTNASEIISTGDDEIVKFLMSGSLHSGFVSRFGTTVHECLHGYDNSLGNDIKWDNTTYPIGFYIDKGIIIKFAGKRLFKTEELHVDFFSRDVKNLFRYETYVYNEDGPSQSSSNQWGFYGLLEEFNAYYHDLRAQIEYFECSSDPQIHEKNFANNLQAYFEFNIFMADYIQFAQKYHPEDYDYLLNNISLRTSYTLMEYNWRNLLTTIMSDKELAQRTPTYDEEFRLLDDHRRAVMNSFMIPNEELSEYSDFILARPSNLQIIKDHKDWAKQLNLTGFGAGMSPDEIAETFGEDWSLEIQFEMKEPEKYYVVILSTKSEEALMSAVVEYLPECKSMGIVMDQLLNYSIYLKKFNTSEKAEKYINEIKLQFPEAKVLR